MYFGSIAEKLWTFDLCLKIHKFLNDNYNNKMLLKFS